MESTNRYLILNRLNGWHRLWIVITILYSIIILPMIATSIPKESDITKQWSYELIDRARVFHPELNNLLDFEIRDMNKNYSDIQYIRAVHRQYKNLVSFSDIDTKFKEQLDHLYIDQAQFIGIGFIIWLLPVIVLYLFGWSIGWIYRGFTVSNK